MARHLLLLLLLLLSPLMLATPPDSIPRRHAYRYAVKKPIIFGEGILPHFEVFGDVMTSQEYLRIAPSVQSKKGAVWSTTAMGFANWEVVMSFSVTGRGRLGGDGMALWLTKERLGEGEAMGAQEQWDGLMLFFDTYDNDNKRNNPYVGAILNDGSLRYSPDTDGADLIFNGCQRNFRNAPVPVFVRMTYYHDKLSVAMDTHGRGKNYMECFVQEGIQIPQGYFFGITAATGALADDHDLLSFEVFELDPPRKDPEGKPAGADQNVNQEQFEKIQEKVHEIRAKFDISFEAEEKYERFLGKLSNMEELLSGLAMISNNQEQIRQTISNALILMERIMANSAFLQAAASQDHNNPNNQLNQQQEAILAAQTAQLTPIISKLNELQQDLTHASRPQGREGSGPSASLTTSVSSIENTLRQIESRLTRLESGSQNSGQLAQSIREEITRTQLLGSQRRVLPDEEEESSNTPVILTVVVVAILALAAGAYFVTSRKSSPKKFI